MSPRTFQNVLHHKGAAFLLIAVLGSFIGLFSSENVGASQSLNILNGTGQTAITSTNLVSTPSYTPRPGEQYIVLCTTNVNATLSLSSSNSALTAGISTILNQAGTVSMLTAKILPTITPGSTEVASTITCSSTVSGTMSLYWFRPAGFTLTSIPVGSTSGSATTTWSVGSVAKTHSSALGVGFITANVYSAMTNPWINPDDFWSTFLTGGISSGTAARRSTVTTAYSANATLGTFYATINSGISGAYRGQVISLNSANILTNDIVNAALTPVASPSVTMSPSTTGFSCQTSTGTLGSASQKIMVHSNDTTNWTLSIAPTSGVSALWTSGGNSYDFNDPAGSGCTNGQLSLDFSTANWSTSVNDCLLPWDGITQPTGTFSFSSGSTDAITLMSSSGAGGYPCRRFVHTIGFSQKIPAEKLPGTYSLPMTVTLIAS